jgi:hypothetical protein
MSPTTYRTGPLFWLAALVVGLSGAAHARPVSYPGGWTVLQNNDAMANSLWVHYSPTARYSVGYFGDYDRAEERTAHTLRATRLVRRWNEKASQGNLYAWGAAGAALAGDGGPAEGAGQAGVSADWETRRVFVMGEAKAAQIGAKTDAQFAGRLGFAPYVGDYGDLHLWLMLQVQNKPTAAEPLVTTPMARLFWDVNLIELGWQVETETVMVNWIIRR